MWKASFCAFALAVLIPMVGLASAPQDRTSTSKDAAPTYDDWLIVDGHQISFKVRIDVFLPGGQPASDFTASLRHRSNRNIDSDIELTANRLSTVLTIGRDGWYPTLFLSTFDGRSGFVIARKFEITSGRRSWIEQICSATFDYGDSCVSESIKACTLAPRSLS